MFAPFHLRVDQMGESSDNLLKIRYLKKYYPDLSLLVQTSPSFCAAGLVTEAMKTKIEEVTQIPMVSIAYDGTDGDKNDILNSGIIIPYLKYATEKMSMAEKGIRDNYPRTARAKSSTA